MKSFLLNQKDIMFPHLHQWSPPLAAPLIHCRTSVRHRDLSSALVTHPSITGNTSAFPLSSETSPPPLVQHSKPSDLVKAVHRFFLPSLLVMSLVASLDLPDPFEPMDNREPRPPPSLPPPPQSPDSSPAPLDTKTSSPPKGLNNVYVLSVSTGFGLNRPWSLSGKDSCLRWLPLSSTTCYLRLSSTIYGFAPPTPPAIESLTYRSMSYMGLVHIIIGLWPKAQLFCKFPASIIQLLITST